MPTAWASGAACSSPSTTAPRVSALWGGLQGRGGAGGHAARPPARSFQGRLRSSTPARWPRGWPPPACSTARSSRRKVRAGSGRMRGQDELSAAGGGPPIPSRAHSTPTVGDQARYHRVKGVSAQAPPGPQGAREAERPLLQQRVWVRPGPCSVLRTHGEPLQPSLHTWRGSSVRIPIVQLGTRRPTQRGHVDRPRPHTASQVAQW